MDEIIAAWGAVVLTALWSVYRAHLKEKKNLVRRLDQVERNTLAIIIALRNRGYLIPSQDETDRFFKSQNCDPI
jgi:hypothetical protein